MLCKMPSFMTYFAFDCPMQIRAEKIHTEMDCIEKGIVELISQHGIRKLVMGAAADKHHSRYLCLLSVIFLVL